MIPNTMNILDTTFKDDSPLNTVERIKGILKSYGIETVEQWNESGVPRCYSLRVSVFGTVFGVNGKGVTKELALASGYGELMERLQLGRIFKSDQQKGGGLYAWCQSDAHLSEADLLERNKKWNALYVQKAKQHTGVELTEETLLKQYREENGTIPATPFYCVNTRSYAYLPTALLNSVYSTNGCAAGNTMEEAIVQAISEIVERHYSARVLSEHIAVPEVPEQILSSYQISYEIITFLRSQNFKVIVKDCSLGTKFPVVCVCLIDQKTGKYHTHFGAYPNFEIALQRTLTESFQSRTIQKVAHFVNFAPTKDSSDALGNLLNQLVKGTSERSLDFFVNSAAAYQKPSGFSGRNNRELLKECIDFISEQGYDILVRDCSCLGFPTYQVIIPGYSEIFTHRLSPTHNDMRYTNFVQAILRDPSSATMEEIMGFMMNRTQTAKQKLAPAPFSVQANLPCQLSAAQERYLMCATMASLNYRLGWHNETVKYIDKMLAEDVQKDESMLICIKRYLTLTAQHCDQEKIRSVLYYFHRPETVQALYAAIAENKNPLDRFALHCDMQCQSSCLLYGACKKKHTDALAKIITTKLQEMDRTALEEQFEQLLT
jgi:ribosomal protein S12 methylthiotransferase accessory factor